jgi:hypothetical protein
MRNPTSSIWKVGWLRRRTEAPAAPALVTPPTAECASLKWPHLEPVVLGRIPDHIHTKCRSRIGTRAGTGMYVYAMPHESEANRPSRLLRVRRYLGLAHAEGGRPLPGASLHSRYHRAWMLFSPMSPRLDQDLDALRAQVEALERRLNRS